jgi:L-fuculose-phosphate aldolase
MWQLPPDNETPLETKLVQLAEAHRVLAQNGHGNVTLGHMSLRDPQGRGFWLKRMAIGLNEVRGGDDFILLDMDGRQLEGGGQRHSEWPIHAEIYKARPDVHVVCHTHPFHTAVFSATVDVPLEATIHEGNYLYDRVAYYRKMHGLVVTAALGHDLAATLGDKYVVIMKNHGVTVAGPRISVVGLGAVAVEIACRAQLLLASTGYRFSGPPPSDMGEGGISRIVLPLQRVDDLWSFHLRELYRSEGRAVSL